MDEETGGCGSCLDNPLRCQPASPDAGQRPYCRSSFEVFFEARCSLRSMHAPFSHNNLRTLGADQWAFFVALTGRIRQRLAPGQMERGMDPVASAARGTASAAVNSFIGWLHDRRRKSHLRKMPRDPRLEFGEHLRRLLPAPPRTGGERIRFVRNSVGASALRHVHQSPILRWQANPQVALIPEILEQPRIAGK